MDFPTTNATVSDMLEWFRTKGQSLPIAFIKCNESITCFALIGVFKMLTAVGCEHILELRKSALSYDASLLQEVPGYLGKIAGGLSTSGLSMVRRTACGKLRRTR
jgi:hypothetical protein